MSNQNFLLIAEACCNHMGDINIAKKMIKKASECGANIIKFQKRTPELCVPEHVQNEPHPCPSNSFGETYLEHRKFLEFTIDQHKDLFRYCKSNNIIYATSVWDKTAAEEVIRQINPLFIKIPSACNLDFDLIDYIYANYLGGIHISLGMANQDERERILKHIKKHEDVTVIYWTTSGYPVPFNELYLLEIQNLCTKTDFKIGYSGHNLGIAVDIAAYTLGAQFIERHFTLDRTLKGTDQAASLEPQGLTKLQRDLTAVSSALRYKTCGMTNDEIQNRRKLRTTKD
jgi:sialic acid synthase